VLARRLIFVLTCAPCLGPRILGVVNASSTPEPEPAEAPQQQPADPTKRPVEPRIGDADRDQAVAFLQEHMAQGRIDASEFDDRMSRALKAKTASQLAVLFDDLPDPRPPSSLSIRRTLHQPPWQHLQQQHSFEIPPWHRTPAASPEIAHNAPPALPDASKTDTAMAVLATASWLGVILFCFATSWSYWWLIFIPIFVSALAGNLRQQRRGRRR
jgi:Domain of unknown function (DUF1707)